MKTHIIILAAGLLCGVPAPSAQQPLSWTELAEEIHTPSVADAVPQIAAIGESTYPGETLVLTGVGLAKASLIVRAGGEEMTLPPICATDDRMAVVLPPSLPLAAAVVWPVRDGMAGRPVRINAPQIWWHWPLRITAKTPEVHIMGRNFKLKDGDDAVYLRGPGFDGVLKAIDINPYQLTLRLPKGLQAGEYGIFAWNGTDFGWSDPLMISVEAEPAPAPAGKTHSAGDFGAVPNDDNDDTGALQKAIDALGSGETLQLDAGHYLLSKPLVVSAEGVKIKGAGAGTYDAAAGAMSGKFTLLKYKDARDLPASLLEILGAGCEVYDLAAENGNDGYDQTVISVHGASARIHDATLVMLDKRNWGYDEPGPKFSGEKNPKEKLTPQVIDSGALFIDSGGRADTHFHDSAVHAAGPGVLIGTLQAQDLEKDNEPSSDGVLIENIQFTGHYAGEPNEKPNPGGSGRAVGVVMYNAKKVMVRKCLFQSADRANRKIMGRTVLALNTSIQNLYLADNRSINVGSHPSAIGMEVNQGEQYLFHYRYPTGGLFNVARADANSVTLDPLHPRPFKQNNKYSRSHYFIDNRGSRVLPEVGTNDHWIVFVCAGRGVGQYRQVVKQEKDGGLTRLVVDKPWRVVPDDTSRFNLTPAYRHVTVFRNYIDTGEFVQTHKTHGVTFWFYSFDNIVAGNYFKNVTSGIVFNSRFRGPTGWNLTRENTVASISGYCGDTSLKPAGYVDHFRVTLDWPKPDDRVVYSIGNAARGNRFENADVGAFLHTRFTGEVPGGLPSVEHTTGGMVMGVIENSIFSAIREYGIVVGSPANTCVIRQNQIQMQDETLSGNAVVVEPSVRLLNAVEGNIK